MNIVKEFNMINIKILAIIIFLSYSKNYSMHEKNMPQTKDDYCSSLNDDSFGSSSDDVLTLILLETECDDRSATRAALRELFKDYNDAQESLKNKNKDAEVVSSDTTDSRSPQACAKGQNLPYYPIIPYSADEQDSYSESRNASQHIDGMRRHSNQAMRDFSRRSAHYADYDAQIRRYLGHYNQLDSEDQKKLAQEDPKLHQAAMNQIEYDNRPPMGLKMKESLQAMGEGISSAKNKISSWWGNSTSSEEHKKNNKSEKISSNHEYLNATAEHNRNARHSDYKKAMAEQQKGQNNRARITQEDLNSIKEEVFAEKHHSQALQKSIELDNLDAENKKNEFYNQAEIEQSKIRLEKIIERINAPGYNPPKTEPSQPSCASKNYMEGVFESLGQSENSSNKNSIFEQKESALGQDKRPDNSTKTKHEHNSPFGLNDAIDFPAQDLITTGRQDSQRIDPKIIEELIADPKTPENIVALLKQTNALQNSTDNPKLRDLSTTTTELILFAETISKKLDEVSSTRTQEEAERYNTLKDTILEVASTLNQYVGIALNELHAKRIENFEQLKFITEQPLEAIKASTLMLGKIGSKLATIIAPYDPETLEMVRDISPDAIEYLQKKSDEEIDKIVSSVKQSFSKFVELPHQEKFRAAVKVGLEVASQILVAKACSQIQTSLRANAAQANALKAIATTTEEIVALEEAAKIISQEQKLVHAVELAAENKLAHSAEKLTRNHKVNEILDAATEFSQSEKAKEILSKLDKRSGKNNPSPQKKVPIERPSTQPHLPTSTVEIPERIKNFIAEHGKAIKKFPQEIVKRHEGHIFSNKHKKAGILNLGKNESEIFKKFSDIILESDKAGLIKAASENTIHTVINGQDVIVKATLDETGKIISMNGYLKTSLNAANKGNTFSFTMKEYA